MRSLVWLTSLVVLSVSVSASAEQGPIWEMSLPIRQSALLKPYLLYNYRHREMTAQNAAFYSEYLRRELETNSSSLKVFGLFPDRRLPNEPFSFPFRNGGDDMADIAEAEFGFCLGFTFQLRRFNTLAFFRPDLPKLPTIEDYFPIVDAIAAKRPTEIPGYASLREFANEPSIARRIKIHIAETWALLNVSRAGFRVYHAGFGAFGAQEIRATLASLKRALALGINPIVTFTLDASTEAEVGREIIARVCKLQPSACAEVKKEVEKQLKAGNPLSRWIKQYGMIHVVQITGVEKDADGTIRAVMWDINKKPKEATNHLAFRPDGSAITPMRVEIPGMEPFFVDAKLKDAGLHEVEGAEVGEMLYRLRAWCSARECRTP